MINTAPQMSDGASVIKKSFSQIETPEQNERRIKSITRGATGMTFLFNFSDLAGISPLGGALNISKSTKGDFKEQNGTLPRRQSSAEGGRLMYER